MDFDQEIWNAPPPMPYPPPPAPARPPKRRAGKARPTISEPLMQLLQTHRRILKHLFTEKKPDAQDLNNELADAPCQTDRLVTKSKSMTNLGADNRPSPPPSSNPPSTSLHSPKTATSSVKSVLTTSTEVSLPLIEIHRMLYDVLGLLAPIESAEPDANGSTVDIDAMLDGLLQPPPEANGTTDKGKQCLGPSDALERMKTSEGKQKPAKDYISSLAPELLARILAFARDSIEFETEQGRHISYRHRQGPAGSAFGRDLRDEPSPSAAKRAQSWIHSLTRVSRSWAHIVPNVAWSRLQLFTLNLLIKATKRVERNDGVAVLMCDFARLNISAPEAQGHYGDDYNGAVWDPTFLPPPPPPPGPGDFLPPPPSPGNIHDPLASLPGKTDVHEAEMEHGDRIAKFLGLAKNLRQIDLVGAKRRYDNASPSEMFMDTALHNALCQTSICSLTMEDLETILLRVKTLKTLLLEGGIDNLDGRDDVLDSDHTAALEHLRIRSMSGRIGNQQLQWLLRPAVGHMKRLEIMLPARAVIPAEADFDGGMMQNVEQPFATAAFANLLIQLASSLQSLELVSHGGMTVTHTDLQAEPHSGALDFALSHCHKLHRMYLPWRLTGQAFLEAVSGMTTFREMSMLGNEIPHTSARDLGSRLLAGDMPKLEKMSMFFTRSLMTNEGWNARDVRELLKICKDRNVELDFP